MRASSGTYPLWQDFGAVTPMPSRDASRTSFHATAQVMHFLATNEVHVNGGILL